MEDVDGDGDLDAVVVNDGQANKVWLNEPVPGDADDDGFIDALDITRVERIIAGLDAPTPGADANGDGSVYSVDITKVERIIARLG